MSDDDVSKRLRTVPANMIGTEFEEVYWLCHDAAGWIDAFLAAEQRNRETVLSLMRMANLSCYRYGWFEGILGMIANGHCDYAQEAARKALDRFDEPFETAQETAAKPRKASKPKVIRKR